MIADRRCADTELTHSAYVRSRIRITLTLVNICFPMRNGDDMICSCCYLRSHKNTHKQTRFDIIINCQHKNHSRNKHREHLLPIREDHTEFDIWKSSPVHVLSNTFIYASISFIIIDTKYDMLNEHEQTVCCRRVVSLARRWTLDWFQCGHTCRIGSVASDSATRSRPSTRLRLGSLVSAHTNVQT